MGDKHLNIIIFFDSTKTKSLRIHKTWVRLCCAAAALLLLFFGLSIFANFKQASKISDLDDLIKTRQNQIFNLEQEIKSFDPTAEKTARK